jgi:hypothetical protein
VRNFNKNFKAMQISINEEVNEATTWYIKDELRTKRTYDDSHLQFGVTCSVSVARLNSVFGLEKVDQKPCNSSIKPMKMMQWDELRFLRFLGFSNHEKGAPRQEISKWSTVYSTFSSSGWSIVRSALFAKGGTSKKRPSPHLHKVPTWSNKVSPQTFQTVVVQSTFVARANL